jgi:dTMP kinase
MATRAQGDMALGKFITFEGGEGSGKSTQVRLLADRLKAAGNDVVITREPGGSPLAEQVRALLLQPGHSGSSPLTEALLFSAARADHLEQKIRPALGRGQWVICDRFADSTRVYQGAAGGLSDAALDTLEQMVVADTVPDLTFILDVPADVGLARVARRRSADAPSNAPPDRYEGRALNFHEKLRAGYLRLARSGNPRYVLIDAERAREEIARDIWDRVAGRGLVGMH